MNTADARLAGSSPSLGFDFGTTNSVIARPDAHGDVRPVPFGGDASGSASFRSVLCFWEENGARRSEINAAAGPAAIRHFIENVGDCRFLQSLKSFAASELFQSTRIYGRAYGFSDLLETFTALLFAAAMPPLTDMPNRAVLGRPVRFAGANPNGALALARYRQALLPFGIPDVRFVHEPVAAAFFFARRLDAAANVLVADFGGGTSDFSIMRFEPRDGIIHPRAIAWSGVGVAGDTFDYRIVDHVVAPALGKGSLYREWDTAVAMPQRFYTALARWNELSIMKATRSFAELKTLRTMSDEPEKLEAFVQLIEDDQGYPLYQAVSAAKERLSTQEHTPFRFALGATTLETTITRSDFERWIAGDLARLGEAVDTVLARADMSANQIDRVFLTGGSSFVPAVRALFAQRFGAARIDTGDELVSIAHGLAMIGERDDIDLWCVTGSEDDATR